MSKTIKEILIYVGLSIFIFAVPQALHYHFTADNQEVFYNRIDQDYETCVERAKEDSVNINFCREIKRASQTTYNAADRHDDFYLLTIFQPILFMALVFFRQLKNQVEELKAKIDV